MEYLVGGLCLLAAVTIVGHGLWLLFSLPFRDVNAAPASLLRPSDSPRRCPRCSLPLVGPECLVCHWPSPPGLRAPDAQQALSTLHAQIEQLERLGALDTRAGEQLAAALAAERSRLHALARSPAAAESAVIAEVVPEPQAAESAAAAREVVTPREPAPSPAQRVAAFVERAQVPPIIAPPAAPRRSWTDWLAGFMEERNIRWGELVGGLLIVCCSIALVISFWAEIEARGWLKFLLFNGVTAAIFGVGFYSEHRWRLQTTSRGLLTIGCLLVPLNFLAIAALSSAPTSASLLTIVGEVASAGLFGAFIYFAGRVLLGRDELALTLGLLLPALAQLLVRRFVEPAAPLLILVALSGGVALVYAAVNFWHLRHFAVELMPDERAVNGLLRFLGLTSFAAALPLALLLYKTGHPVATLRELPALAGLSGFVPLCAGLTLWQKLAGRSLVGLRTAGTSVAVMGALVTLAGLVVGWPQPAALLPAALTEFAIFTFIAWRFGMPAVHLIAAPCLALAYLVTSHAVNGLIRWTEMSSRELASALVSGESGVLLAPLVLAYLGAALVAWRRSFASRRALVGAAVGLMSVSVALVSWFGLGPNGVPLGSGWVYLLYASCWLVVAARVSHPAPAWIGSVLLTVGVLQEGVFQVGRSLGIVHPEVGSLLVAATLLGIIALVTQVRGVASGNSPLAKVAWRASLAVSMLAMVVLAILAPETTVAWQAAHWGWIAALLGVAALALGWMPLGALFQAALALATLLAAVSLLAERDWFVRAERPWLDPWTWQAVGLAWVAMNFMWAMLRLVFPSRDETHATSTLSARLRQMLASPWMTVDRVLTVALVGLLAVLGAQAALPGIVNEISPAGVPPAVAPAWMQNLHVTHEHAGHTGSWALLVGLLVLLATMLRDRAARGWIHGAFLVAACGPLLIASRFTAEQAGASAWAWSSVLFLFVASMLVWGRRAVTAIAQRLGWPTLAGDSGAVGESTLLVLLLGLIAPVGLGLVVSLQALGRTPHLAMLSEQGIGYLIVAIGLGTLGATLWVRDSSAETRAADAARPDWPAASGMLLILLGLLPCLAVVLYHVAMAISFSPIQGPDTQSIFGRLGWPATYAGPSLLIALTLAGYALRQRSGAFALAAGGVLCAAATAAYLITNAFAVTEMGLWIRLAQLNAFVAAGCTLCWIALAAWDARREGRYGYTAGGGYFAAQALLAPAILTLPLAWAWANLVRFPVRYPELVVPLELSDGWGALALAITALSVWVAAIATERRLSKLATSALLVALAVFAAGIAARWDGGTWLAYHTLYVGHGLIAAVLIAVAWHATRGAAPQPDAVSQVQAAPRGALWPVLQSGVLLGLAFRQIDDHLWWAVGGLAVVGLGLLPALACVFQRRRYLYPAVPLVNLAGLIAASEWGWIPSDGEFFYWNIILLALPVPAWLAIERWRIGRRAFKAAVNLTPVHRVATRVALAVLTIVVGFSLAGDANSAGVAGPLFGLNWIALAATGLAIVACLYDDQARDAVALLYTLGLVACGVLLDVFNLTPFWLLWTGTMVLAAYALATSYLWSRRQGVRALAAAVGISRGHDEELAGLAWLVPCNTLLVMAVTAMSFLVELTNERTDLRILASQATLVQVMSLGLLARGDRRGVLQLAALALAAVGTVYFGWAWLDPATSFTLLHGLVVVAAATAGVAAFYGLVLSKLLGDSSEWLAAAQRLMPALALASGAAVVATLALEVAQFAEHGTVAIAWPAIVVVGVTLAALTAALLAAAVLPGRDPLGLSERGRGAYVYAAEIILALLFVHIRVTCPWLFSGFWQQFWPLVVMAIAYLGVGAAELFRRRQQHVLSEPLENTGALLTVLPVIGYWAADSRVDYSLLLLFVGVLYGGLSIARRSFGFGVLAAVAANGGLWFLLNRHEGWGFLEHPQVWLIPPALCVLAAAYLNRRQLSEAQMTSIRYFSSMAVYLSSTADIFLNGVAENPELPMVLAGLSIVGILAGILLRVRAFLFLGTSFLALAMFTVIWYAAVDLDQTWIWYASGIILGILVIVLFALFEKKRQDLLEVVERLKQWEA